MQTLGDKLGKVVRITSSKGVVQYLTVVNLDDEGFVHTLNDGILNDDNRLNDEYFWTTFDDITDVQSEGHFLRNGGAFRRF